MTTIKRTYFKFLGLVVLSGMVMTSCEREVTEGAPLATFPTTAEVYTDNPVGLTDEFFISFDPVGGANTEAFGTDDNEAYLGTSSIRIDVPAPNDPNGNFVGGIFKDRGEGRNLTDYDALTFWVKGSTTATVGTFGFGTDFETSPFPVEISDIQLSTDWRKVIIPIPNSSKLIQEKGLFLFSAGSFDLDITPDNSGDPGTVDLGYTFWIDEIKYEKLGTIGQYNPVILNGEDIVQQGFINVPVELDGFQVSANLGSGENVTVSAAPGYFEFESSNPEVATVDENGLISVIGTGEVTITASMNGIAAEGSLTLEVEGNFNTAPVPPDRLPENVVSLFSDVYNNVPVRHYNGFFLFATTQGGEGNDPNNVDIQIPLGDSTFDNIINYRELNFVSIGIYETVPFADASGMTHLHVDINVRDESIQSSDFIRLEIESNTGAGNPSGGSVTISGSDFTPLEWLSLDIELTNFSGSIDFANVGQLFFVSDGTISNIFVDNVYFYSE